MVNLMPDNPPYRMLACQAQHYLGTFTLSCVALEARVHTAEGLELFSWGHECVFIWFQVVKRPLNLFNSPSGFYHCPISWVRKSRQIEAWLHGWLHGRAAA